MPTYDYLCQKCGHRFEFFQSMKDDPLENCTMENCTGKLKRLIGTGSGIIFKGSGFYETDYRSESYKKAQKLDQSSSSDKKSNRESTDTKKSTTKSNNNSS